MLAEVECGKLKTVRGDKDNPDSQGFLCVRGRSTNEIFGNPGRLLYPQIRDDRRTDTWRRVSWDEALDFIARRMRTVGPEAVGLWAGHWGFTPGSTVTVQLMQRFSNIYGCRNWRSRRCSYRGTLASAPDRGRDQDTKLAQGGPIAMPHRCNEC